MASLPASSSSPWMLPPPADTPSRLAALLHRRQGLTVPVDVHTASAAHAHVERCDWPYDCDALTVGLGDSRPAIYLKDLGDWQSNRIRFTLAHELGHVLMGWHLGTVACNPGRTAQASGPDHPSAPVLSRINFMDLEREANRFASSLLLPWDYLNQLAAAEDMGQLLAGVDAAQMSAFAGLLGLTRALQPGFVFTFNTGTGERHLDSPSTHLPYKASGVPDEAALQAEARATGTRIVSGRRVRWYRLVEYTTLPEDDGTTSKTILTEAIGRLSLDRDAAATKYKSIQSVTGGLMSKERDSAEQLLALLRHRLPPSRAATGLDADALDRYIVARVRERFVKRGRSSS